MKSNITLITPTGAELTVDVDKIALISEKKADGDGSSVFVSGVSTEFKVKETADEILTKIHKARCLEANEKVHINELT